MIKKAFKQLPHLKELFDQSDFYSRAYPSNSSAGPSLHDIIMDAPLGSMNDSVWHDWCHVRRATRSIFHIFQQNGYSTNLFGAFGLEKKLDPHSTMYHYPGQLKKSLELYGIDDFETQDAAFTCQMAFAHDKDVISRVCNFMEHLQENNFTMINLLGCQDVHKCNFENVEEGDVSVPGISIEDIDSWSRLGALEDIEFPECDPRHYSENVIHDDPRNFNTEAGQVQGLRRSVMLYDWLRGDSSSKHKSDEEIMRTVTEMHRFAWKCLIEFDKNIGRLLQTLKNNDLMKSTALYITSDHPISLLEHGEICEAPWDSCLKTFLLIRMPCQITSKEIPNPYSLANLSRKIMNDCDFYADWHVDIKESTVITLGLCPSWLCRAFLAPKINVFEFKTFFIRSICQRYGRLYSIIVWFSIKDLMVASQLDYERMTSEELSSICERMIIWENPVLNKQFYDCPCAQIFDLSVDPSELSNLVCPEWLQSSAALSLKADFDNSIKDCSYEKLHIKFPKNLHDMTPDKITFCSVQLHHRVRDKIQQDKTKSVVTKSTQTDTVNLSSFLSNILNEKAATLIMSKIQRYQNGPLTIFVPDDLTTKWFDWIPNPINGVLTIEQFHLFAQHNIELKDIYNTNKMRIKMINKEIILNSARLEPKPHFIAVENTKTQIAIYRITKHIQQLSQIKLEDTKHVEKEIISDAKSDSASHVSASNISESTFKKTKSRQHITSGRKIDINKDKDKDKDKEANEAPGKGKAKSAENKLLQNLAKR
tara:strand:+ start:773 stop:3061 length:2289 start_codon:yes stop_codon:yes gene_type:complete